MYTQAIAMLTLLAASALAAPAAEPNKHKSRSDAATVYFTPYKEVGCRQSQNPYSTEKPESFVVTSGQCFTPSYSFASYVESTNFDPSTTPCALSIYPEPDCGGDGVGATLTTWGQCVAGQGGASFELFCGP